MKENISDKAVQLIRWINEKAIDGMPPLSSAEALALEYLIDLSYPDDEERIESMINWEATKNFTTGFLTGFGGILTMPVSLPARLGASWIVQARMSAAIAKISGFDLQSDEVRILVAGCLVGYGIEDIVADTGLETGKGLSQSLINKIPGQVLVEINKKVGLLLLAKAGEKTAFKLAKGVPLMGGVIGGAFDARTCRRVGKNAKNLFYSQE